MFRIVFVGEADQRFGHNFGNRNGAASGKRMLRSHCHANAFVKQLLTSCSTRLQGRNDQSELKPAITYPVVNGVVAFTRFDLLRLPTERPVRAAQS